MWKVVVQVEPHSAVWPAAGTYKKQISFTVIFKFQLVVFAIRKQISLNSLPMPLHSGPPGDIITSVLFCGSCFHSCSIIHNLNLCSAYASGSFPSFYAGARLALRLPLLHIAQWNNSVRVPDRRAVPRYYCISPTSNIFQIEQYSLYWNCGVHISYINRKTKNIISVKNTMP